MSTTPTLQTFRAVSTLILRARDDADGLVIEGTASSATPDSYGDVIEPKGAVFDLPMPLLMQHDRRQPIGTVESAKVSAADIVIRARVALDSGLAYVDDAVKQLRAGLVRGLSIGAQPLKAEPILNNAGQMTGVRYTAWRWVELSAVTIPGNQDATIDVVRSFDPWGAALFGGRHDPRSDIGRPEDESGAATYEATRARAMAALEKSARALRRG
jgi:HK97 family phage prohead protease